MRVIEAPSRSPPGGAFHAGRRAIRALGLSSSGVRSSTRGGRIERAERVAKEFRDPTPDLDREKMEKRNWGQECLRLMQTEFELEWRLRIA